MEDEFDDFDELDEFKEIKEVKSLFEKILGSEITIKDDIDNTEEKVFTIIVQRLEDQVKKETDIHKVSGLEIIKATEDLWFVAETCLKFLYGELGSEAIMWYILWRKTEEGEDVLFDDGVKEIKLNTIKRLWKYVRSKMDE